MGNQTFDFVGSDKDNGIQKVGFSDLGSVFEKYPLITFAWVPETHSDQQFEDLGCSVVNPDGHAVFIVKYGDGRDEIVREVYRKFSGQ